MGVLDKIRVEVETPTTGLPNLAKNPSGLKGGWGWVTPTTGVTLSAAGGLRLTTRFSQPTTAYTEAYAVAPGDWTGGRINLGESTFTSGHTLRVRVQYLDSTKAPLSSGAQSAGNGQISTWPLYAPTSQAPAGAAYARLRVDLYNGTGTSNPSADASGSFRSAMLTKSATDPGTSFAYVEPVTWTDVTASALDISATVPALDVGIASCAFTDPALDSGTATGLAPGRRLRLSGWNGTGWQPFFEGSIGSPLSTYLPRFKVSVEATNVISRLAGIKRKGGVGTIAELPYILEGQGVPWSVEGNGNQVPTANFPVAYTDSSTLLDQVAMTRDSDNAYAWVDAADVLQLARRSTMPTTVKATLTDTGAGGSTAYRDIDIDKGNTEQVINSVTVIWLRKLKSGKTKEITRGPFVDQGSIDAYGVREQTFTLQGNTELTGAQCKAYAADVLAANATPTIRAHSVTLTLRTDAERALALSLGMYDVVRVSKTGQMAGVDHRIVSITHRVERARQHPNGHKWLVTYALAPLVYVEPPPARRQRADRARRSVGGGSSDDQDTEGLWQAPSFLNSWGNQGAPWAAAGYQKLDGVVYLKGSVVGGAVNTNMFALPAGYRPAESRRFAVPASAGFCQIHINNAGGVAPVVGNVMAYVALDGISFPAEQ